MRVLTVILLALAVAGSAGAANVPFIQSRTATTGEPTATSMPFVSITSTLDDSSFATTTGAAWLHFLNGFSLGDNDPSAWATTYVLPETIEMLGACLVVTSFEGDATGLAIELYANDEPTGFFVYSSTPGAVVCTSDHLALARGTRVVWRQLGENHDTIDDYAFYRFSAAFRSSHQIIGTWNGAAFLEYEHLPWDVTVTDLGVVADNPSGLVSVQLGTGASLTPAGVAVSVPSYSFKVQPQGEVALAGATAGTWPGSAEFGLIVSGPEHQTTLSLRPASGVTESMAGMGQDSFDHYSASAGTFPIAFPSSVTASGEEPYTIPWPIPVTFTGMSVSGTVSQETTFTLRRNLADTTLTATVGVADTYVDEDGSVGIGQGELLGMGYDGDHGTSGGSVILHFTPCYSGCVTTTTSTSSSTTTSTSTTTTTSSSTTTSNTATTTTTSTTTSTTISGMPAPDWSDESALVQLLHCESETSGVTPDASPTGNPMTLSTSADISTTEAWSGSSSCHMTSTTDPITCESGDGCTQSDFWFTSSFTIGCASYITNTPVSPYFEGWYYATDTKDGSLGAGFVLGVQTSRYFFSIDRTTASSDTQLNSTSGPSLTLNTWMHHVARYTTGSRLMEQFFNGSVGADTTTLPTGDPFDHDTFVMGNTSVAATARGYFDECFAWDGSTTNLTDEDICRVAVCDWDGSQCLCDTGTPANYADAPRHTSFGGSMTCTLPACNKASPG